MEVTRIMDSPLAMKWQITLSEDDFSITRDAVADVWRVLDKIAEKMNCPPFCPCGQRPHRIFCLLGFNKYFRPVEEARDEQRS